MTLRARYVEIPVTDIDRAERFYREVFMVETHRDVIDGHDACILDPRAGHDGVGAEVVLMRGESYVPSIDGTRVYLTVDDVEGVLRRALDHGAELLYPVTRVGMGPTVAEFCDSEGNRIALADR